MFVTRLLSGIALVVILLAVGVLGGNILWGFCLAISLIGLYEFYRVFKIEKSLGIIGYGFAIVYYLALLFYKGSVNGALFLAIELMMAGASAVQVGMAVFTDPYAPLHIIQEMHDFLDKNRIASVRDIIGTVQPW